MDSVEDFVVQQTQRMRQTWYDAGDLELDFSRTYSLAEKKEKEAILSDELDWFSKVLEPASLSDSRRNEISSEAAERAKAAGKMLFELNDQQVDTLEKEGIARISSQFFKQAREFDPDLPTEQIFQASRNVWTMNYLQVLLDLPVELSKSVFAYSMLYPVSDNLLDDPCLENKKKLDFSRRFSAWLRGEDVPPEQKKEEQVLRLIKDIECQYPRSRYSQVYESLLAIHAGQEKSLRLPCAPVQPYSADVLGVAIEKGGTSVLADGVLVAGELVPRQMEIIFNYGVFAQFMDDQEDVEEDIKKRSLSLFTECAAHGPLDKTMNRLFAFSRIILKGLDEFDSERSRPLKEISLMGIDLLLIDACARTSRYYSQKYLASLETHFPFRFRFLREVRKKLKKRNISVESVMRLFS